MKASFVLSMIIRALSVSHFVTARKTAYFSRSLVTSSSDLSPEFAAMHAFINSTSAWCPRTNFTNEYLQLDFGGIKIIKEIKIAGEASPPVNQTGRKVTKYLIQVSADGVSYKDFEQISKADVTLRITIQYMRIVPLEFDDFPCLRIEVYGCKAKKSKLCSENNGGCSQKCIAHSEYCLFGKCFFDCQIDFLCTKWAECQCYPGYNLLGDKTSCKDVDECKTNNGNCDHLCENSPGSYQCKCHQGFAINSNNHTCDDVNECNVNNGGCNDFCHNTYGSYYCSCRVGFQLQSSDNHTCNDIDECSMNNGGCSYGCQNLQGSYYCTCPTGFKLDSTQKNCKDSNECLLGNGGCETYCHNTNGSYYCSCLSGFELYDKLRCKDIDECATNHGNCSTISTECHNFQGGYNCRCKKGYKYIQGDYLNCEVISCPPLVEAAGTEVSPPECLSVDGRRVNDTCVFSCDNGYRLPDPNQASMICLDTGAWDRALITCQRKSCPAIPVISNGTVTPTFSTTIGNLFGEKCYYSCNTGYRLNGNSSRTCQANEEWDDKAIPTCEKVHPKPWVRCPSSISPVLEQDKKEYDATGLIVGLQSNVQNIQLFPAKFRNNLVFPYGLTILTYVASNEVGDTANCTTSIIVRDEQPPRVVFCPQAIHETIIGSGKNVTWKEPTFSDNVEIVSVTSTSMSGDYFGIRTSLVRYDAFDKAGLSVSCKFNVSLEAKRCVIPDNPDNGSLLCTVFSRDFILCSINCHGDKQTFQFTFPFSCTSPTFEWPPIPDCVDAVLMPASNVCPSGKIKQGTLAPFENRITYCVNCPRGMKYDSALKDCVKCPVGYISTEESSPNCTRCPLNSSTPMDGSKVCIDLCDKGKYSVDGFDIADNGGCTSCSVGFYQDQYGETECKKCPNGLTTVSTDAMSLLDCGGVPSVTSFGPPSMSVNVSENTRIDLICMGIGTPRPTFVVKKSTTPQGGFEVPLQVDHIRFGSVVAGVRYIIVSTTDADTGLYSCSVTNTFGSDTKYLNLFVHLDSGSGVSGSGAGI
ncbi:signal peptide, CUB and EGF-like domain-containing protein 3 [Montipora foliosa]|uniref:signal peptide, CUB and EGF-like domain-containing protein 3 n=1 Tax=Montipora foliosa TaxID=591990 RepID=UPI0035F1F662